MYYNDSKMEEALAEILDISLDTVDMLNLTIENDIGHDDFFYGYYVEFPQKTNLGEDILSNIKPSDVDKIPWGETKYYSESQFSNTSIDPFGYQAEYEEYEYYHKTEVSKENILVELNEIRNKIQTQIEDKILVKSLLFSAFSITENYIKHIVVRSIPDYEYSNVDEKIKQFLRNELLDKLYKESTRQQLFNKFTGKKLLQMPYKKIRNHLAHSMFEVKTIYEEILIDNSQINIFNILNELKNYISEPFK